MKVKVSVHKNQTKHHFRPFSMYRWADWTAIGILATITFWTAVIEGWYTLIGMGFIWLFMVYAFQIPTKKGYLQLDDSIRFHSGWRGTKRIRYSEIGLLSIGRCPVRFTKPGGRGHYAYTMEQWEKLYGTYIIAEDTSGKVLFVCHDSAKVRKMLTEKCIDTAISIFDEKSYAAYHQKLAENAAHLKAIEQRTAEENGGQEILDEYQGYVN